VAKKVHAPASQNHSISSLAPVFILLAGWTVLISWQMVRHFPWHWEHIAVLWQWQRFGPFSLSVFFSQWLSVLKNILLLLAFLFTSYGLGRFIMLKWFAGECTRLDTVLYSLGLGFIILSLAIFVLGVLRLFYSWLFVLLLFVGTAWGVWTVWQHRRQLEPQAGWLWGRLSWTDRLFLLPVVGFLGWVALMVNVPEIFFDALVYHLAVPAAWIQSHGIHCLPYNFFSNFPMGIEMLYTGALMVSDERLCRMLHAVLGLLTALTIFSWGRRWFGRRTGLWAAGLFLTTPVVAMNMLVCGVDVGASFFAVLGFALLVEWVYADENRKSSASRLAGLFMGMAVACKYNTAFMLAPAVLSVLIIGYQKKKSGQELLKLVFQVSVMGLILILPWLIKNTIFTGNPVYPFLYKVIPSRFIHPEKMQQQMDGFREYGQRSFIQYLRQPWDLTFFQATSNSYVGVVYLFLLPGILLLAGLWHRGPPELKILLLTCVLAALIWSSQTRITRYFIPALPLLTLLSAFVLSKWEKWYTQIGGWARLAVTGFIFWGLLVTVGIGAPHWDPVGVCLGLESRDAYLDRKLLNSYSAMARKINQLPGKIKVLLVGETRSYYINRPKTAATVYDYNPFIEWIAGAQSAEAVWQKLRAEGYTHIFIHYQEAARTRGYEPYRWDEAALDRLREFMSHYLQEVAQVGQQRLYKIVATPMLNKPVKLGRPLFTYDPDIVRKLMYHQYRARIAIQQGRKQDARAAWRRMLELAPEWHIPYLELGWFYLRQQQKEEAFYMYQQAEQLAWLDAGSYNNLGVQYLEHEFLNEAKRCFELALELDPNLEIARKNLEIIEKPRL